MAYDDIDLEGQLGTEGNVEGQSGEPSDEPTGAEPSTGGGVASAAAAAGPAFDGNQFQLIYRGQPVIPKTKDELINLAQRGYSYSDNMRKIKEERTEWQKKFDELSSKYKQYDQFDQLLKSNPTLGERIVQMLQEGGEGGQPGGNGSNTGFNYQLINKLTSRIDELEKLNNTRLEREDDRQLQEMIQKIRGQYADHDWDYDDGTGSLEHKLLQFAYDNGINNLEMAYKAMFYDKSNTDAKAAALKKAAEAKKAAHKAGIVDNGTPTGGEPKQPGYKYGMSYNQLADEMKKELNV